MGEVKKRIVEIKLAVKRKQEFDPYVLMDSLAATQRVFGEKLKELEREIALFQAVLSNLRDNLSQYSRMQNPQERQNFRTHLKNKCDEALTRMTDMRITVNRL